MQESEDKTQNRTKMCYNNKTTTKTKKTSTAGMEWHNIIFSEDGRLEDDL